MRTEQEITLPSLWLDIRGVLARRRKLVALTALATVAAVYIGLLFVSDEYMAQASLLVRLGRENLDVPVTVERGTVFADGVKKEEVNSQIALLTSTPLILSTIDAIGVDRIVGPGSPPEGMIALLKYRFKAVVRWGKDRLHDALVMAALSRHLSPREQARILIDKRLSVTAVKESDVIQVELRLPDPVLARDFLDALTKEYLRRHSELRQQVDSVSDVFDKQAQADSDRLAALREQSTQLKAKLGVSSASEQKAHELDMLKAAQLANQESQRELAKLEAEDLAMQSLRTNYPEMLVSSAIVEPSAAESKARDILGQLRVERARALAKYDADTDPVKRLDVQIAELESFTNSIGHEDNGPKTYAPNPIVQHMDFRREDASVQIATLRAGVEEGDRQIAQIKSDLQQLDRADADLQRLQLEISVAENRFTANASKREEARTSEIMDRMRLANVAVLSSPTVNEKPVGPKRLLTVALALAVGLAAGICCGLVLEWQSDVIYDGEDLNRDVPGSFLGALRPNGARPTETTRSGVGTV